ncbi:hypothetical protein OHA25_51945 [Nonomuraea sp. NBC_00507]
MRTPADVIDRFNRAFVEHDPAALTGLSAGEVPLAAADGEDSRA